MAGDRIGVITRFHIDALYPWFGLPAASPANSSTVLKPQVGPEGGAYM
jgi:hypothetical protein